MRGVPGFDVEILVKPSFDFLIMPNDFHANSWRLRVWRDVAKLRKEHFGQPRDICHFHSVSGFNAAFGDASPCWGVIAQQIPDADLVQAVKVRGWTHFDVAPFVQFDFVWQILKARIVDHVLPGEWSCVCDGCHVFRVAHGLGSVFCDLEREQHSLFSIEDGLLLAQRRPP